MKDNIPVSDYKWVYDDCHQGGEYITTDGNHMVRIEYLMKMPMTKADYLRMYKRQIISKTDYETCLRRLK